MLCGKFGSWSWEAVSAISIPVRVLYSLQRIGYTDEWRRIKHYHSCQNPLATVQGIGYFDLVSFDATSVSRRETFVSMASQSLKWYRVKGNTTLSLPIPLCFHFFPQRRYTTKLSTITRIISKSFSFTDSYKENYMCSKCRHIHVLGQIS